MIPDDIARTIIHGSPQGYDLGCRSNGGCANHGHPNLMTCAAAHAAAGSDWSLSKLPRDEAIPKRARRLTRPSQASSPAAEQPPTASPRKRPRPNTPIKHGTPHGFNRGCKTVDGCPNHGTEQKTCADAHRSYYRDYRRRVRSEEQITHGTPTGYSYGCHDRGSCPGNDDGTTCPDAARAAERRRRQSPGSIAA
ncbi:hypothetical protein [Microbacterium oleivorans]|uniref:hypothetical protein n=1 Tax=Microbacterium oleivorans TaxID=273677 RepID=UPI001146AEB5|nr:hypothetical protein [Microbacterium oleivorans]